jgi:hypothetical protein
LTDAVAREARLEALRKFVPGEFERAAEDAGFDLNRVAHWISEQTPAEILDRGAMYFTPKQNPEAPHALTDAQYAEATSIAFRDRHRIVVHLDYMLPSDLSFEATKAYFAAVLRHELEHARQQEASGGQAALEIDQALVDLVLRHKVGGLSGGAVIYNCKPIEIDANAAAAVYVRRHYPHTVDELLSTPVANLVRSNTGPEDPGTLLRRTVCFLFQFQSIAERLSGQVGVAEHLRLYDEAAADLWRSLVTESDPITPR